MTDRVLSLDELAVLHCTAQASDRACAPAQADAQLRELPGWRREGGSIDRKFEFSSWLEALCFVQAVGWMAHCQDHHPDISLQGQQCQIRWSTHSSGGLSRKDFVCAARTDRLSESFLRVGSSAPQSPPGNDANP